MTAGYFEFPHVWNFEIANSPIDDQSFGGALKRARAIEVR